MGAPLGLPTASPARADYTGTNTPDWAIGPFTRYAGNPVLQPQGTGFESTNVFNAGVIITTDPNTHAANTFEMLYRAQDGSGTGGISRIGYATSTDGHTWTRYANNPVITPVLDTVSDDPCGDEDPRLYTLMGNGTTGVPAADQNNPGPGAVQLFYTFYTSVHQCGNGFDLSEAWSTNLTTWNYIGAVQLNTKDALVVADPTGTPVKITVNGTPTYVMYFGQDNPGTYISYSLDMLHWHNVANINNVSAMRSGDAIDLHLPQDAAGQNGWHSWEIAYAVTNYKSYAGQATPSSDVLLFIAGNLMSNGRWFYAASELLMDGTNLARTKAQLSDPVLSPMASYERHSTASTNAIWMNSIFFCPAASAACAAAPNQWWMYYGAGDQNLGLATAPLHDHLAVPNGTKFSTSFETGQQMPDWNDSVDCPNPAGGCSTAGGAGYASSGGIANVGFFSGGGGTPEASNRQEATHTGTNALLFAGSPGAQADNHAYMKLFDVAGQNIVVGANTTLSYWVYPVGTNRTGGASINSTCVALDLIFTDGTASRNDTTLVDQNGVRLHPTQQCMNLPTDQWDLVTANLGQATTPSLIGKTVARIDVGYDQPTGQVSFRTFIDDISITDSYASPTADPASLVNPFIGTGNSGATDGQIDTFPGADYPFGMVQWSPDTNSRPAGGGYNYDDGTTTGFSLTHLSGPGCPRYGDIPILPTTGSANRGSGVTQSISHVIEEQATPGYYQAEVGGSNAQGILSQLTVSKHTGMGIFTFPYSTDNGHNPTTNPGDGNLVFKLDGSASGNTATSASFPNTSEIDGQATAHAFCNAPGSYTVYFAAQFDHAYSSHGGTSGTTYVTFDTSSIRTVTMKVGVSFVSIANAKQNLTAETSGFNFDTLRTNAHDAWNSYLSRIAISGGSFAQQRTFYTALYHALLHPNLFSDSNGQYHGFDGSTHNVSEHTTPNAQGAQYANFSGWDIYHSQIPLLALIAPTETGDMMQSYLNEATEGGWFDRWPAGAEYTGIMSGDPADAIIAEAYAMGVHNFDAAGALAQMIKGATQTPTPVQYGQGWFIERPQLGALEDIGYIPNGFVSTANAATNIVSPVDVGASVTLEYSIDDFAIAQLSAALNPGDTTTYNTFMTRGQNWQNVFNFQAQSASKHGYVQARNGAGYYLNGDAESTDIDGGNGQHGFAEGNSAQYTWLVPQNFDALFAGMGGKAAAISRLDSLFSCPTTFPSPYPPTNDMCAALNAGRTSPHHWAGNEPDFGAPWAYDYAGAPYRTQGVVRQIMNDYFNSTPAGEPGNDDLGSLSSWYVWAALGLYPETPGSPVLALNSPLFPSATLSLKNGHQLVISATNAAANSPYVQSLSKNGSSTQDTFISADELAANATTTLDFTLGNAPSLSWGVANPPPSYSTGQADFEGSIAAPLVGSERLVDVAPGGSPVTTATLTVHNMTDSQATFTLNPTDLPSGLHISIPVQDHVVVTNQIVVGAGATSAAVTITVSADPGTVEGIYVIPLGFGGPLSSPKLSVRVASANSFLAAANSTAMSADAAQWAVDFDGFGNSLSRDGLAGLGLSAGATIGGLTWPNVPAGQLDNVMVQNQTINITGIPNASTLAFLGTATNGNSTTGAQATVTPHYSDLTSGAPVTLTLTDWTLNGGTVTPRGGNTIAAGLTYRNWTSAYSEVAQTPMAAHNTTSSAYVFLATVPLDNTKTLTSIGLSGAVNGSLHIFAVGTPPAATISSVTPTSFKAGDLVTITGTNFGAQQGAGYVSFADNTFTWTNNSTPALTISSWSDTQIQFIAPAPGGAYGKTRMQQGTYPTVQVFASGAVSSVYGGANQLTVANSADLRDYYNSIRVSPDSNRDCDIVPLSTYLSSDALVNTAQQGLPSIVEGGLVAVSPFTFRWPNPANCYNDAVAPSGQTILLPSTHGTTQLGLLGTGPNGASTGTIVLTYTDNSTFVMDGNGGRPLPGFGDWCNSATPYGTSRVKTMNYRNDQGNLQTGVTCYVFLDPLTGLDPNKIPYSITLPSGADNTHGNNMRIFAIALNGVADTTTTVAADNNPSVFGQPVTFTATVSSGAAGTPTGFVQFKDGLINLGGQVALDGSGHASSGPISSMSVGAHNITAVYSGDSSFATSTNPIPLSQTVDQASTTSAVSADHNPSSVGQQVTFTATVAAVGPGAGTPSGSVQFKVDNVNRGSPVNLSGGQAHIQISDLTEASHTIAAVYSGDTNFTVSTSPDYQQDVEQVATSTDLASSDTLSDFGQGVTFTATVTSDLSGSLGVPTGSVTFKDGVTTLCASVALNGSGQATCPSVTNLSVGVHSISAFFVGTGAYVGSDSTGGPLSQTVQKATTSASVLSNHSTSVHGQSVTFTATVTVTAPGGGTPTGTVDFLDGATTICSAAALNGSAQATCGPFTNLTTGGHSITVSYGGSSNYLADDSSVLTQTVNQAATTTSVTSTAHPSVHGQAITFTATVAVTSPGAGTPTGTINFKDNGTTITGCAAVAINGSLQATCGPISDLITQTHPITAVYSGDTDFATSTSIQFSQVVNKAATSTALLSDNNPADAGEQVTFTATVSATAPGAGTPTGTVAFKDGATTIAGCSAAAVNGSAQATCQTSTLSAGSHTVTAVYASDTDFAGSTSTGLSQVVNTVTQVNTTTTLTQPPGTAPSVWGQSVTFTATVAGGATPTGTVVFKVDGVAVGSPVALDGSGQASIVLSSTQLSIKASPGHTIGAVYSGDSTHNGSTAVVLHQIVKKASTAISLTSDVNPQHKNTPIHLTATVTVVLPGGGTPTGKVVFKVNGVKVGSFTLVGNSGIATFTITKPKGSYNITATYKGDTHFLKKKSAIYVQKVIA